jgi:hypothetical protein
MSLLAGFGWLRRTHLRAGAALLALCMLWAALAPTVVRLGGHGAAPPAAAAPAPGGASVLQTGLNGPAAPAGGWVEVCTASGSRWVWLGNGAGSPLPNASAAPVGQALPGVEPPSTAAQFSDFSGGSAASDAPTPTPSAHAQADCAWCLVGMDRVLPPALDVEGPPPAAQRPVACAWTARALLPPPHARPAARAPPLTA